MRKDMFKVIVERPRWGSATRARNRAIDLGEEASARETTGQRHRDRIKGFTDHLNPLKRWLEAQVDRPWDKVYAELCEGIDRRSAVQQHIHEHVEDFVAVRVVRVRGELWSGDGWRPMPLADVRQRLYVDPATGILRRNEAGVRRRRAAKAAYRESFASRCPHPRVVVTAALQLHRLDGIWYAVEVRMAPPAPAAGSHWRDPPLDVLRGRCVYHCPPWHDDGTLASSHSLYGDSNAYAAAKRQLDRAELKRHGLHNDNG